ncbi:response regulator [Rhodoferax sp. PAMC 29310]|uniref:response regulator n=1 Tax=Rhodoferax sp. PAMC 29310 TaxID=2822760 RepID=UPI001B31E23B|nr:response regulator [Rhodoferax sp. PAMC 29310]
MNPDSPLRAILVVEDNDMDLDFCLQAFEEHAITNPVYACRDGDEAMAYVDTYRDPSDPHFPLLVLLDLRLPKIDGIDVLRHARARAHWDTIPIIALTTSTQDDDRRTAFENGVSAFVTKPVSFDAFSAVIQRVKAAWMGGACNDRSSRRGDTVTAVIRLLYAEDNALDADLTRTSFAHAAPDIRLEVVGNGATCLTRLALGTYVSRPV